MVYLVHLCGHLYFLYTPTFLVYLSACFVLFSSVSHSLCLSHIESSCMCSL